MQDREIRNREDFWVTYLCGRCDTNIEYLKQDGIKSSIPCPDCGWTGGERREDVLPPEVRIDLTQY